MLTNSHTNPEQTARLNKLDLTGDTPVSEQPKRAFSIGLLWDLVYYMRNIYEFDTTMNSGDLIEALVQIIEQEINEMLTV